MAVHPEGDRLDDEGVVEPLLHDERQGDFAYEIELPADGRELAVDLLDHSLDFKESQPVGRNRLIEAQLVGAGRAGPAEGEGHQKGTSH